MSEDSAQTYLATPATFDLEVFKPVLSAVLDAVPVACVRLSMLGDESHLGRAADQLRKLCHARDVAIVVDDHYRMVVKHGLDGVHLTSGGQFVREARKELGNDAIVGAHCGVSKHAGMTAAEIGTDYISFGPLVNAGSLGDGIIAEPDLFQWWSEMIEVPVVAQGPFDAEALRLVAPYTDFVCFGREIWQEDDPLAALQKYRSVLAVAG